MKVTFDGGMMSVAAQLKAQPVTGLMLINGRMVESQSGRWIDAINPANGDFIGRVPEGNSSDVDAAVQAALPAQKEWKSWSVERRMAALNAYADKLQEHADILLGLEVADSGNTITGMRGDINGSIARLRYMAGLSYELQGRTIPGADGHMQITWHEPYGVVGRIVAFNHPFGMAINGIAGALAAGNAVVIKPSEYTSLSACYLGYLSIGILPDGLLSIVTGQRDVGVAISQHIDIKKLSFVGAASTGRAIQRAAAETAVKSVALELGGKNPFIVFPDAPISKVADAAILGMNFTWQGQSCCSTSRLFLHEDIHDEVLAQLIEKVGKIRVGNPFDNDTQMGAMNSLAQLDKTKSYVKIAQSEGARLVCGGDVAKVEGHEGGFWHQPTVFADVTSDMRIAQEEVFGPILSVIKWREEDQVIAAANSVEYGLAGAVWSADFATSMRVATQIQSGYLWVNGINNHTRALPFGGLKNSGIGRERGIGELQAYSQERSMQLFF